MRNTLMGLLLFAVACSGTGTVAEIPADIDAVSNDHNPNPDIPEDNWRDIFSEVDGLETVTFDTEIASDAEDVSSDFGPICDPSCPYPVAFDCLGHLSRTTPATAEFPVQVSVRYSVADHAPIPALEVRFCAVDDLDCSAPIVQGVTDASGLVNLDVLVDADGFKGYFDIRGESWLPRTLYFFTFANGYDAILQLEGKLIAYIFAGLDLKAVQDGVPLFLPDATRGTLVVRTRNCLDMPASGISISSGGADVSTTTAYSRHGIPRTHAEATDVDGVGYLLNHPDGTAIVSATAESDGVFIGQHSTIIRKDSVTFVQFAPAPAAVP